TPVRLFDGRVEPVESLMVGDYLMGPDNKPRMVLSTTYGRGPLFTVTQDRGMSYVCNDAHILALQNSKGYVEISVSDFLKLSKKEQKDHRSIQASIDYPSTPPPRDPYQHGLDVVFSDSLVKEEDIPDKEWEPFLVNDREVRLQFLAGILDSAAYFTASTGEYELTLNRPHYMDRVFQVARSLGYDCTYPVKKTEKLFNNTSKDVYRMHIQGVGKDNAIPCRLERKQPTN